MQLNLGTRVFLHFAPIEMWPPGPGIEPASSSLAARHISCGGATAGYVLLTDVSFDPLRRQT